MAAEPKFSQRIVNLKPSPIREILSVVNRPGMISFAGGLPNETSFPEIELGGMPQSWLQYGPSEGEPELRAAVAADVTARGLPCTPQQVLILSGSQQGIDLVSKLFIDRGTTVAVESPTYLAALQVFRFLGARFSTFRPTDLIQKSRPVAESAAFAYAIPTFQNPSGHCYSAAERAALAAYCDAHDLPLFEDDPYRDLHYDACERVPVCAQIQRTSWIYQGSFSKVFAPGLRLGYLVASENLMPYLVRLKQAADLHSNRIGQWLALRYLQSGQERSERIERLIGFYREKRDCFAEYLTRYLAPHATWSVPAGGLFFWLTLNRPIDTQQLLAEALERCVAFMPGEPFFPNPDEACSSLRLNFSFASADDIDRGLKTLATLLER